MVSGLIFGSLYAGCGKCQADMTPSASKQSNALVTTVPKDGNIDGIVIASCGKCNFGVKKDFYPCNFMKPRYYTILNIYL